MTVFNEEEFTNQLTTNNQQLTTNNNQPTTNMNIRTDILLRVYIAFGMIVLLAFAVLYKLVDVQIVEGKKWRSMADSLSTRFANVEAARGNIYSVDGSLLAT